MRTLQALLALSVLGVGSGLALAPQAVSAQAAATMPPVATGAPSANPMGASASPAGPGTVNPMESGFVSAPQTPNPFASPTSTPALETETATSGGGGGAWGLLGLLGLLGLIGLRGSSRPT
jgi:hypothetical protein